MALIGDTILNDGDTFFLFAHFPYDYSDSLPLQIIKGVDLVSRPVEWELVDAVSSAGDKYRPYCYVLPLQSLPVGSPLACIRISSNIPDPHAMFWQVILALRLIKPLQIGVSGAFTYTSNISMQHPGLYWIFTPLNCSNVCNSLDPNNCYTGEDFIIAAQLLKEFQRINSQAQSLSRMALALDSFGQVTIGRSTSYSMIYLGLFASLESLFYSVAKAERLGPCVSNFLASVMPREEAFAIGEWVEAEYGKGRNNLSHGNPYYYMEKGQFCPGISCDRYSELLKLHEIVRICLLAFLGLTDDELRKHSMIKSKSVENNSAPILGSKIYLANIKMRLDHPYYR